MQEDSPDAIERSNDDKIQIESIAPSKYKKVDRMASLESVSSKS